MVNIILNFVIAEFNEVNYYKFLIKIVLID